MKPFFSDKFTILLASKSPRRRELIQQLCLPYRIISIDVEESFPDTMNVLEVPEYLAKKKANAVSTLAENEILLTADTDVILGQRVLGKPRDLEDAKRLIKKLSGREHIVITGVCLKSSLKEVSFSVQTKVKFHSISEKEIDFYLNHFEVLDKAGAYGIQHWIGHIGIESINGDYNNIVGLPISAIYQRLKKEFFVK